MQIRIIFDKEAVSRDFYTGWGVSFLVDNRVLFDTGESGIKLIHNMEKMNVDFNSLKALVISHDHWDHTGGLWSILNKRKGLKVYSCPGFSWEFKNKVKSSKGILIESDKLLEVANDIFVTGEIAGRYNDKYIAEQALIVKTTNGITIVTGCSHPGILKVISKVRDCFLEEDIYLVFGGFHLKNTDKREIQTIADEFKKLSIRNVGPTHCSGKDAEKIFKKLYKDNFIPISVGGSIEV